MKILIVLANYYPYVGGSELLFQRLAEGLVKHGHQVKVITTRMGPEKDEIINGVEVERIKLPFFENPFMFTFMSIPRVIKLAKEFDIIQTSSNYSALSAFIGSVLRKRKIVITCHEVLGKRWAQVLSSSLKAKLFRLIETIIVRLPYNRYICISNATREDLIRVGVKAEKSQVIYPGVELDAGEVGAPEVVDVDARFPDAKFICGYFGRPGVTKGVKYLVEAIPKISKEVPGFHLVMVLSPSPELEYLKIKSLITDMGLITQISLIPSFDQRKDLFDFLRQTDCIVIPSLTEGFGFTTVEASSLDVPVVASAVGSIPEVIFGSHVLVEAGNPNAIAAGVIRVFQGDVDYLEAKDFNWDTMINEYDQCYQAEINT